jgi:thiol-disulfide isomerase/thioredoxin
MFKRIIWVFFFISIISCNKEETNFVTISGAIENSELKEVTILGNNFSKTIGIENGKFSDTLKVNDGVHIISSGTDKVAIFLKNGYNLDLNFKGNRLSEGISFSGKGAGTNNYMISKNEFYKSEMANPKTYFELSQKDYELKLLEAKETLAKYRKDATEIDSLIYNIDLQNDEQFLNYIESNYSRMHETAAKLAKGVKSPEFNNYENFDGSKTSLSDLKGKYVYIDVWATWCGPCKAEIPSLKALEEEFHGKNIEFVSISVDKEDAYDTWRKMVADEELKGIQLYADKNFESDFILEYGINSIPRFILIDPDGNIVDANTSRPSNPRTKEMFIGLGI